MNLSFTFDRSATVVGFVEPIVARQVHGLRVYFEVVHS